MKTNLKSYNNIKVANDTKQYYETDGLVVSRLFLDHYGVFPNVVSLKPADDLTEDECKKAWFSFESTLETFEKENISFNIRSVNVMDSDKKLSDRHYVIFLNDRKCIIAADQQRSEDNYFYEIYYKNYEEDAKAVIDLIWKNSFHTENIEIKKKINFITTTTGGFGLIEKDIEVGEVNIEKNYNDDFQEVDEIIKDFISSKKNNNAGLIILNGAPGTGKSYYIKSLINRYNKQFIFVTQNIVNQMSSPEFISFLMSLKNSVLILEDCENVIMSRDNGNTSSAISNILNICDGILSDVLNIKIIVTFNTDLKNIDKALMRKGRLKYQYTFGKLNVEKTKALLKELHGEEYNTNDVKEMTLADIYNIDSNNAEVFSKKKSIGFGS